MALRDAMKESATGYLRPGEPIQAVIGAQTASQYLVLLSPILFFLPLNRFRMIVVTPDRILVLDTGKFSMKKARSVAAEWPRATRLGPGTGLWHRISVDGGKLRVHRRFFKDMDAADGAPQSPGHEG